MTRRRSLEVGSAVAASLLLACGGACETNPLAQGLFLPPGDNEAACRTISPGNEISVRVAYRGRTTKLIWSGSDAMLDRSTDVETITLVATAPDTGFVLNDIDGRLVLLVSREDGLTTGDYRDSPLLKGQQPHHFEVTISSVGSVNGVPTRTGAGKAEMIEYRRTGAQVTMRMKFTAPLLNLATNTIEDICGEAFFDGIVQIVGDE